MVRFQFDLAEEMITEWMRLKTNIKVHTDKFFFFFFLSSIETYYKLTKLSHQLPAQLNSSFLFCLARFIELVKLGHKATFCLAL